MSMQGVDDSQNSIGDSVHCDLLVIGGGINGVGIANDAAGRCLRVVLCEQHDLAAHTSSASSKLIHGGLRYLEQYQFRLVRESLAEREVLLAKAPHLVHPLRIQLPYRAHLRPRWMLRIGLFLYDHLARRSTLSGSQYRHLDKDDGLLQADIHDAFEYSDCQVDDARLVIVNALQARQLGARILTRTRCTGALRQTDGWLVELCDTSGQRQQLKARVLVNAAGPWAADLHRHLLPQQPAHPLRLVQGSHLVVPRIGSAEQAWLLQSSDGRVVFVLPWEQDHSLIGTTDRDYQGDPAAVRITPQERDYLLALVNGWFQRQLTTRDVLWEFAGVRALVGAGEGAAAKVSRDYQLIVHTEEGLAPLLEVYGGKLTTYRRLAEAALEKLRPLLPAMAAPWTAGVPLPGGDIGTPEEFAGELCQRFSWLPPVLSMRLARSYGSLCLQFLQGRECLADLGRDFGAGLSEAELEYLRQQEWACSAEDVLWRRSKLGLRLNGEQQQAVADWFGDTAD